MYPHAVGSSSPDFFLSLYSPVKSIQEDIYIRAADVREQKKGLKGKHSLSAANLSEKYFDIVPPLCTSIFGTQIFVSLWRSTLSNALIEYFQKLFAIRITIHYRKVETVLPKR